MDGDSYYGVVKGMGYWRGAGGWDWPEFDRVFWSTSVPKISVLETACVQTLHCKYAIMKSGQEVLKISTPLRYQL